MAAMAALPLSNQIRESRLFRRQVHRQLPATQNALATVSGTSGVMLTSKRRGGAVRNLINSKKPSTSGPSRSARQSTGLLKIVRCNALLTQKNRHHLP